MKMKASISYHSTATAVFSRISLTLSPLVLRNLPIHVAANEDVSQLPEIIISPVDSRPVAIDRFTRLVRANRYCLGATLCLHWNPKPNFTLHAVSHLNLRFLFTFAEENGTIRSHALLNSKACDTHAMLSENTYTWQKIVKRWELNVNNGKKATLEIYLYFYTWENIAVSEIDKENK